MRPWQETAALRDFDSAYVRFGVIFIESTRSRRSRQVRFAPVASEVRRRSESTRCGVAVSPSFGSNGHCFDYARSGPIRLRPEQARARIRTRPISLWRPSRLCGFPGSNGALTGRKFFGPSLPAPRTAQSPECNSRGIFWFVWRWWLRGVAGREIDHVLRPLV
jgi:hypothetical protein